MAEGIKDTIIASSPTVTKSLPGQIPAPAAQPAPKLPEQNVVSGGDFFSGAGRDVNTRTKALLEAVATGGKRGLDSFKQAETAIGDYRKQALGRAQSRAALVGGPEAQGFETIADQQYGARLTDLAQSGTAFTEDMARRGIAGKGALDQMAGILPILKARTEAKIMKKRDETLAEAKDKISKDWESRALGQAEIDEQTAAKNIATLEGDLAKINKPIEDARTKMTELDTKQKQIEADMKAVQSSFKGGIGGGLRALSSLAPGGQKALTNDKAVAQQRAKYEKLRLERDAVANEKGRLSVQLRDLESSSKGRLDSLNAELEKQRGFTPESRSDRARTIAQEQLGIDPSLVTGKIGAEDVKAARLAPQDDRQLATAAKVDLATLREVRKDEDFVEFAGDVNALQKQGKTWEEVEAILRDPTLGLYDEKGNFKENLFRVVVAQYRPLFPTISEVNRLTKYQEG